MKRLSYFLQYIVLKTISLILCSLPEGAVYAFARTMGLFAFHLLKLRRRVSMDNLRHALGNEKSEAELIDICRRAYINIGMTFIELLLIPRLANRIKETVDMSELPVLQRAIARGRGAIVVSGHFGNWELVGASIRVSGIPITGVAAQLSNPYVDAFINRHRIRLGLKVLYLNASAKHLVREIKNHELIGLVSDQDAGRNGVFVDFFGRPASTPRGPAQLALKYGAPAIVCLVKRTGPGRYRHIFREVETRDDDTIKTFTQRFTSVMEEVIRQHPEQYFWMHRRWKTRPAPPIVLLP